MGHPTSYGGPKLIAIDIDRDAVIKEILLPPDVAPAEAVLDGLALACDRDHDFAFVTDAMGGLVVANLRSGESWRTLENDDGMRSGASAQRSGGVTVSENGKTLYYRPHRSSPLYAVNIQQLIAHERSPSVALVSIEDLRPSTTVDGDPVVNAFYVVDDVDGEIWRARTNERAEVLLRRPDRLPRGAKVTKGGSLWVTFSGKQPSLQRFEVGAAKK